jgi:hypothetical protein
LLNEGMTPCSHRFLLRDLWNLSTEAWSFSSKVFQEAGGFRV